LPATVRRGTIRASARGASAIRFIAQCSVE
jgi:hypothetical protein